MPRLFWRAVLGNLGSGDEQFAEHVIEQDRTRIQVLEQDANLVSSLTERGLHMPALDLDFPCRLRESSPGRYHLFMDREITWTAYTNLLDAMFEAGLIERGFFESALASGSTFLRTHPRGEREDLGPYASPTAAPDMFIIPFMQGPTALPPENPATPPDAVPPRYDSFVLEERQLQPQDEVYPWQQGLAFLWDCDGSYECRASEHLADCYASDVRALPENDAFGDMEMLRRSMERLSQDFLDVSNQFRRLENNGTTCRCGERDCACARQTNASPGRATPPERRSDRLLTAQPTESSGRPNVGPGYRIYDAAFDRNFDPSVGGGSPGSGGYPGDARSGLDAVDASGVGRNS